MGRKADLTVLSLGAGVQSTFLYIGACEGLFKPLPDVAIFADTQQEPPWVYENLWRLCEKYGDVLPIDVTSAGDLGAAIERGTNSTGGRFAAVPFWVEGADGRYAPGRRQCTREYKIDVVKKHIRTLLGLQPRQRISGRFHVEEWVGISTDEAHRAKPSRYDWITSRHPLLEHPTYRRSDAEAYLARWGWPMPKKSACVFCPYRTAAEYARWRDEEPEMFERACKVDDLIRSSGTMKGTRGQQYVTKLLVPLRELPPRAELEKRDDAQLDLFGNECEGMCGV